MFCSSLKCGGVKCCQRPVLLHRFSGKQCNHVAVMDLSSGINVPNGNGL